MSTYAKVRRFADIPFLLAQLQTALRRRERKQDDRIIAKVLARGLEAVLVTVKQGLDSGVAVHGNSCLTWFSVFAPA